MLRFLMIGMILVGAGVSMPSLVSAQTETKSAASDDPNDKSQYERSFEETRAHMKAHSEWSKKTGKMNDN